MKSILFKLSILVFSIWTLTSCISQERLTYLQESEELEVDTAGFQMIRRSYYKVQKNDLLHIQIRSMDPDIDDYFQKGGQENTTISANSSQGSAQIYFNGYSVNPNGYINLPVIGDVFVEGLSANEITDLLYKKAFRVF